jgi:hypothetical protein
LDGVRHGRFALGDGRWLLLGGSGELETSGDKRSHSHFIERVHDDVCTSGGQQVAIVPASDADRAHPARLGRLHPSTCILHHDRAFGLDVELVGRCEEHLGVRFSVCEVPPGDVGVKVVEQRQPRAKSVRPNGLIVRE